MPRDGSATRTALLDAAEELFLDHGVGGTSIERIIDAAGVTRGALFHHFDTKQDLADAVLRRWSDADLGYLEQRLERVERLSEDPLQQLLLLVALYEEDLSGAEEAPDGCLLAAYAYQSGLLDEDSLAVLHRTFATWQRRLREKLDEVVAAHPPRVEVDLDALADTLNVLYEGGFVVDRARNERGSIADQLRLFRSFLGLLFGTDVEDGGARAPAASSTSRQTTGSSAGAR